LCFVSSYHAPDCHQSNSSQLFATAWCKVNKLHGSCNSQDIDTSWNLPVCFFLCWNHQLCAIVHSKFIKENELFWLFNKIRQKDVLFIYSYEASWIKK
jgi:hypothetical protein